MSTTQQTISRQLGIFRPLARIPRSSLLNFAAILLLFLFMFILQRLGERITSADGIPKSSAPTTVSALSEAPTAAAPTQEIAGEAISRKKLVLPEIKPEIEKIPEVSIAIGNAVPKAATNPSGPTVEELDSHEARMIYLNQSIGYSQSFAKPRKIGRPQIAAPALAVQNVEDGAEYFIPFEKKAN